MSVELDPNYATDCFATVGTVFRNIPVTPSNIDVELTEKIGYLCRIFYDPALHSKTPSR